MTKETTSRRRGRPSAADRIAEITRRADESDRALEQRTVERDQALADLAAVRERSEAGIAQITAQLADLEVGAKTEIEAMRQEVAKMTAPPPPPGPRAYLLMRSDLSSMGVGKCRAQSMHAGNALTWALMVEPLLAGATPAEDVAAWHREAKGFGTAISLGGPGDVTGGVIAGIMRVAKACGMRADEIVDDTYPYRVDAETMKLIDRGHHTAEPNRVKDGWICFRREVTGMWMFGTQKELEPLLARFGLTPDA